MPEIKRARIKLKTPWLRVLRALNDGVVRTQALLVEACGFSPISGTIRTALNGIREGSSSGRTHLGLIGLGLVERLELDIDGIVEVVYRITEKGLAVLDACSQELPPLRDKSMSTNRRYKERPTATADRERGGPRRVSGPSRKTGYNRIK